jgi:small subunit ribosomal protein S6
MAEEQTEQNLYEGMYVLKASLNDEERKKAFEKIKQQIVDTGGDVVKIHDQGRKKLAYEIDGQKEGYYYLIYFNAIPKFIAEFWKEYHLNQDLLRFITLRAEKVLEKIEFKPLAEEN